jgi:excisionase family DNA binding protein
MTAAEESRTVLPPAADDHALARLSIILEGPHIALVGLDGMSTPLPEAVRQVLKVVVDAMSQGLAVSTTAHNTQLTVQEASELLCIQRPRLVRLLDHGAIPFEHRGRQRVVKLADIINYQERLRATRHATLDEMTQVANQDGTAQTVDGFPETR